MAETSTDLSGDARPVIKAPRGCKKCGGQNLTFSPRGQLDGVSCTDCGWSSQVPAAWGWNVTEEVQRLGPIPPPYSSE